MHDTAAFLAALGDVPAISDPDVVRRKSRDMTANFSPVMKDDALRHVADVLVYRRDRALQDVLRPYGLLTTEWRTLGTLHSRGPMAMQELAQWTAYERTRLTRMLHGLEERSLVTRGGAEHDGRAVMVAISAKGRRLYARAEKAVSALTDEILSVCAPAEVDRMRAALQAMRERLIEMRY